MILGVHTSKCRLPEHKPYGAEITCAVQPYDDTTEMFYPFGVNYEAGFPKLFKHKLIQKKAHCILERVFVSTEPHWDIRSGKTPNNFYPILIKIYDTSPEETIWSTNHAMCKVYLIKQGMNNLYTKFGVYDVTYPQCGNGTFAHELLCKSLINECSVDGDQNIELTEALFRLFQCYTPVMQKCTMENASNFLDISGNIGESGYHSLEAWNIREYLHELWLGSGICNQNMRMQAAIMEEYLSDVLPTDLFCYGGLDALTLQSFQGSVDSKWLARNVQFSKPNMFTMYEPSTKPPDMPESTFIWNPIGMYPEYLSILYERVQNLALTDFRIDYMSMGVHVKDDIHLFGPTRAVVVNMLNRYNPHMQFNGDWIANDLELFVTEWVSRNFPGELRNISKISLIRNFDDEMIIIVYTNQTKEIYCYYVDLVLSAACSNAYSTVTPSYQLLPK